MKEQWRQEQGGKLRQTLPHLSLPGLAGKTVSIAECQREIVLSVLIVLNGESKDAVMFNI